jgi:hypothetical protein
MPPKKKAPAKTPAVKVPAAPKPKFPRATLENALRIAYAIKDTNGGNPWEPEEIRKAIEVAQGNSWYALTAASRDYGLTSGTRESPQIALEELGREIVYAPDPTTELTLKKQAFLKVDIFKRVLDYYKGSNLPDMKYLGNVLTKQFGLDPEMHEEFAKIFRENSQYLGITSGVPTTPSAEGEEPSPEPAPGTVTLAEGSAGSTLTAFVILPFVEREDKHPKGFFAEVLRSINGKLLRPCSEFPFEWEHVADSIPAVCTTLRSRQTCPEHAGAFVGSDPRQVGPVHRISTLLGLRLPSQYFHVGLVRVFILA